MLYRSNYMSWFEKNQQKSDKWYKNWNEMHLGAAMYTIKSKIFIFQYTSYFGKNQ